MPLSSLNNNVEKLRKFLYVTEQKPNRSPEIDMWNKYVHNPMGSAYCAACVSWITDGVPVRSGLARNHAKGKYHTAGEVLRGEYSPKSGDKIIWARGKTINGHIGFVIYWNKDRGRTIEANTSSDNSGSQYEGDGVREKNRKIEPYNYFRVIGFVEM